jgi:hypothetical protein
VNANTGIKQLFPDSNLIAFSLAACYVAANPTTLDRSDWPQDSLVMGKFEKIDP